MKLKSFTSLFIAVTAAFLILLIAGCGAPQKVETAPTPPPPPPKEPTIEELRKPVTADNEMKKVIIVIRNYGLLKKQAISYEKYKQLTKGSTDSPINPDWFYDNYVMTINLNKYSAPVTLGTARYSGRNPKIKELMSGLPENSISISPFVTPSKKKYVLVDYNCDGILDYAKPVNAPASSKISVQLLDEMQERYTWLLSIIKKKYKASLID